MVSLRIQNQPCQFFVHSLVERGGQGPLLVLVAGESSEEVRLVEVLGGGADLHVESLLDEARHELLRPALPVGHHLFRGHDLKKIVIFELGKFIFLPIKKLDFCE